MTKVKKKNVGVVALSSTPFRPHKPIYSDCLYNVLDALVRFSSETQRTNRSFRNQAWVNDFCTIKLGASRGTGHTTTIIRYILDQEIDATIFCENCSIRNVFLGHLYNETGERRLRSQQNSNIVTFEGAGTKRFDGQKIGIFTNPDQAMGFVPNAVFVDSANQFDERMLSHISGYCSSADLSEEFFQVLMQ
jgi:hypothetical protein